MRKQRIFVSAVTRELVSSRKLVCDIIEKIGYESDRQDIFGTEAGDLRAMLARKIDACDGVLQLVGHCYGAEPREIDPAFDRVSYTQYEAKYAEKAGKKVWYVFLSENFPTDPHPKETAELAALQNIYRAKLRDSDQLRHPASSAPELSVLIYQLRDYIQETDARRRRGEVLLWIAAIAIAFGLVGLGAGIWRTQRRLADQKVSIARVDTSVRQIGQSPAISEENLVAALASADAVQLNRFSDLGVPSAQFEVALSQKPSNSNLGVARQFFDNSRRSTSAIDWLKRMLAGGFNSSLLVDDPASGRHSILIDAILAGNAPAILALLGAGASPHAYEDLWLQGKEVPIFLFPYAYIEQNPELTLEEKRTVMESMRANGGVALRIPDPNPNGFGKAYQVQFVEQMFKDAEPILGHALAEVPPDTRAGESLIAERATRLTGFDWSAVVRNTPARFHLSPDTGLYALELRNLLCVSNDRAYFLGFVNQFRPGYALAEVSKDGHAISVYVYMDPAAGMGLCHCGIGETTPPQECWRRWNFTYDPATHSGKLDNYYPYTADPR